MRSDLTLKRIETWLGELRRLVRGTIALRGFAIACGALAALVLVDWGLDRFFRMSPAGRASVLVVLGGAWIAIAWRYLLRPVGSRLPDRALADLIERGHPELEDTVRSAVDFRRQPGLFLLPHPERLGDDQRFSILMKRRVVEDAAERLERVDRRSVIDWRNVRRAVLAGGIVLAGSAVWAAVRAESFGIWFQRNVLFADADWPYATLLHVEGADENGRFLIPHGDPLPIRVRAEGEDPILVAIRLAYRSEESRANMVREEDGAFAYTHGSVTEPFSFTVEGGDYRTRKFEVISLERPRVENLRVTLEPPSYTALPPIVADGELGELAAPEGSRVALSGRANKPLRRAWIETENRTVELAVTGDAFEGAYLPEAGGGITVWLEDVEQVPPNELLRFSVHLEPDRIPKVGLEIAGLGPLITSFARVPLVISGEDDYRIDTLRLEWSLAGDPEIGIEATRGEVALPEPDPKERQVDAEPVWEVSSLSVGPERRLDLRVGAEDNDGLHGAKTGWSGIVSFLIVTPERLGEEFVRREEEQRRVLERVLEKEKEVRDAVFRLVNEAWSKEEALSEEVVRDMLALARIERQHARQCEGVADAIRQIVVEMQNNRVGEADDLERLASLIVTPLRALASDSMPAAADGLRLIREVEGAAGRLESGLALSERLETQIDTLDHVIASMRRLESFTAIVKYLRGIIKTQEESIQATEKQMEAAIGSLFEDEPIEDESGGAADGEDRSGARGTGR